MSAGRLCAEVLSLKKKLKKQKDSPEAVADVLGVLKETKVDRKVLEETRIGRTVAKLLKSSDKQVKTLANELVTKWKQVAKAERESTKAAQEKETKVDEKPKKEATAEGAEEQAEVASVFPTAKLPGDDMRKRVVTMLKGAFKETFSENDKLYICAGIEAAMFSSFGENTQSKEYKSKFRSLKFNISKNADIRLRLLRAEIEPQVVVSMKASDLASNEQKKKREAVMKSEFDKSRSDYLAANRDKINEQAGIDKVGGLIPCESCGSMKTTHYQKQTRGADEPMTVFANCTDCGHNWRFGDH